MFRFFEHMQDFKIIHSKLGCEGEGFGSGLEFGSVGDIQKPFASIEIPLRNRILNYNFHISLGQPTFTTEMTGNSYTSRTK